MATTYTPYDYSKITTPTATTTQAAGNTVSYGDVNNQINKAANTYSTANYQDPSWVGNYTNSIMDSYKPQLQAANAATQQQYNNDYSNAKDYLANYGMNKSGAAVNQLMGLDQSKNQQMAANYNNLYSQAGTAALSAANTGLTEQNQLANQASTAASQLSNLLSTEQSGNQWATQFNADQTQNAFGNNMTLANAQASENQYGQTFNADQAQNEFNNGISAANLTGTYNGDQTLAAQNQTFNQGISTANLLGTYNGQQTLAAQNQAQQYELQQGELLGSYNGQDTLGAQQLASSNSNYAQGLAASIFNNYSNGSKRYTLPDNISTSVAGIGTTPAAGSTTPVTPENPAPTGTTPATTTATGTKEITPDIQTAIDETEALYPGAGAVVEKMYQGVAFSDLTQAEQDTMRFAQDKWDSDHDTRTDRHTGETQNMPWRVVPSMASVQW